MPNQGSRWQPPDAIWRFRRGLLPLAALAGLGVGIFLLVDTLLNDGGTDESAADTSVAAASEAAPEGTVAEASVEASETAAAAATESPSDAPLDGRAATAESSGVEGQPAIITPVDLDGAPVVVERGHAMPVPSGGPPDALADDVPYDPADKTVALSSIWGPGTVLELTRLPGGPLLDGEDAERLIGSTIQVVVAGTGEFATELQLSPAAYQILALVFEPIIAVHIEVVGAPPR